MIVSVVSMLLNFFNQASSLDSSLLQQPVTDCSCKMSIGSNIVHKYFRDQHSVTIIDFSKNLSVLSSFCTSGNVFLPLYIFDEWNKVNFGKKINDSGMSAYSTTRGYHIISSYNDVNHLFPVISRFNPRAKLLIQITENNFEDAETLLKVGFEEHKMLNVAVIMHFTDYKSKSWIDPDIVVSFCMLNPFQGDATERKPEFKCFNFTMVHDNDFERVDDFIRTRVTNLHQYPLRVDIFDDVLISRAVRNEKGIITHYKYVDGDTVTQLAGIMKFSPIYKNIDASSKFGYQLPNGTFIGSLGSIEYDRADFAAIPIFIADYGTKNSLFLQPIAMKKLLFLIKKRDLFKITLITVFYHFDKVSSFIAISLCILFPIIYITINRIESRISSTKTKAYGRDTIYIFALMNNISSKHSTLIASRVVVATILFYTTMISALFQGTIIKNLNQNQQAGAITTVNQLLKENYDLTIDHAMVPIFKQQGGSELGERLRTVAQQPEKVFNVATDGYRALRKNSKVAFLSTHLMLAALNKFYDNETGENLFESVPESVFEFYVSPMVPKHSPFIETFNFWLMKYQEVGIQIYQFNRALDDVRNVMIYRVKNGLMTKFNHHIIELHDLISIFYFYLLLLLICVSTFVMEILYFFIARKCVGKISIPLRFENITA